MWVYLNIDNYLIRANFVNDSLVITCTNLKLIWHAKISLQSLLKTFKELNPSLDMEDKLVIRKTMDLYTGENSVKHNITSSNVDHLLITSSSSIGRFPYSFQAALTATNSDMLFNEWTKPVLCLLENLHNREQKLLEIIRSKEAEIEQYKEEGAQLKRKGVITTPFSIEDLARADREGDEQFTYPASIIRGSLQLRLSEFMNKRSSESTVSDAANVQSALPAVDNKRTKSEQLPGPSISLLSSGSVLSKRPKLTSRLKF